MYLEAESEDGHIRDVCVFTSEKTTVDHGSALVEYDNGVKASYNLAFVCAGEHPADDGLW